MNFWKIQRSLELSELEKRAPHCAETIRRLDKADEEIASALVFSATEKGRDRFDVIDRLTGAQKCNCSEEVIDVLLLVNELCG